MRKDIIWGILHWLGGAQLLYNVYYDDITSSRAVPACHVPYLTEFLKQEKLGRFFEKFRLHAKPQAGWLSYAIVNLLRDPVSFEKEFGGRIRSSIRERLQHSAVIHEDTYRSQVQRFAEDMVYREKVDSITKKCFFAVFAALCIYSFYKDIISEETKEQAYRTRNFRSSALPDTSVKSSCVSNVKQQ